MMKEWLKWCKDEMITKKDSLKTTKNNDYVIDSDPDKDMIIVII